MKNYHHTTTFSMSLFFIGSWFSPAFKALTHLAKDDQDVMNLILQTSQVVESINSKFKNENLNANPNPNTNVFLYEFQHGHPVERKWLTEVWNAKN